MKNIEWWTKLLNEVAPGTKAYSDHRGIFWACRRHKFVVIEADEHGHLRIELRSSIFEAGTTKSEYLIIDGKHVCEMTPDRYDRLKEIIGGFVRNPKSKRR